ncbi:DoxX family protein [Deinococcus pimensis]|uniref:DoxX family protein n=1 Tax=Deinococcus pimensis TaxID=309888 RepID=UPI000485BC9F|nr:DoxX family protein [Deinococcus pimensis]
MDTLFSTPSDPTTAIILLILRVTLGVVIFPHGAQKLLGWYGGFGYKGTMGFFTQTMHIPYLFGLLAIVAEFFGAIALILGVFTKLAALGIGVTMAVAAWTSHRQHGFFMNWFGQQKGEGLEFFLLTIGIAAALTLLGAGSLSIDALF